MKKYIVIISLLVLSHQLAAQQSFPMNQLILKGDTLIDLSIINGTEIKWVKKPKDNRQIFINDYLIDSIKLLNIPFAFNDKVYFNAKVTANKDYRKVVYLLRDKKNESYDFVFYYDYGFKQAYIDSIGSTKIYLFNPATQGKDLFVDFWNIVKKATSTIDGSIYADESFQQIFFINKTIAFVSLCYNDGSSGDGCTEMRFFIVYGPDKKVEITNKLQPRYLLANEERLTYFSSQILLMSSDGKYINERCYTDVNSKTRKVSSYYNRLFDNEFNYISDLLLFQPSINGVNIQNGVVQNYFLNSYIDADDPQKRTFSGFSPVSVIIPYKFNPTLELAMYKAYNNTLLIQSDIKGLGKYELGILRNLIFAKYNYRFSSEFYQAYFNLYEFYGGIYGDGEKRKSRIKDVSGLLTDVDKANIKLIQSTESK